MKNHVIPLVAALTLLGGTKLANAQATFIPPYSFTGGNDGSRPEAALIQASDGNLYGTTPQGGTNSYGTIFRIANSGVFTRNGGVFMPLYSFTILYTFTGGHDGGSPAGGLVQASDGNLYGTTQFGGTNGGGTVFRITTNGFFKTLYSFNSSGSGGSLPRCSLVQASDGNLYGTTFQGGANGYGTIFCITTNGTLTPLYSFTNGHDGANPECGLVQANDGNLYGTTYRGGTNGYGTVFRITTGGAFTPLYSFTGGYDGGDPAGGLVQASDGNLYGTTQFSPTSPTIIGTIFRITTNGVLTLIYSFTSGESNGAQPQDSLIQASDGNLYGTAQAGGTNNNGTIFCITTNGVLTLLYSFTGGSDGARPAASLVQASDGNLYGTTPQGGTNGYGTVFDLSITLPSLGISASGNQSVFFWPAWAGNNHFLQSTTNLSAPIWVTVSNAAPIYGFTMTNSLPAQFFRLVTTPETPN